jgi:hypothetical protein
MRHADRCGGNHEIERFIEQIAHTRGRCHLSIETPATIKMVASARCDRQICSFRVNQLRGDLRVTSSRRLEARSANRSCPCVRVVAQTATCAQTTTLSGTTI